MLQSSDTEDEIKTQSLSHKHKTVIISDDEDSDFESSTLEKLPNSVSKTKKKSFKTRCERKEKVTPSKCRASASSTVQSMFKGDRQSAAERFLENNEYSDSEMDDFLNDDSEESSDGGSSSSNSNEILSEENSNSEDSDIEEPPPNVLTDSNKKSEMEEKSDDEVSPIKRRKSQNRINSDDSDCCTSVLSSGSESSSPEVIYPKQRKRRKKLKRVLMIPDSQDAEDNTGNENLEQNNEHTSDVQVLSSSDDDDMSDFIVSDSDSVSGEDGATPIFYPQISENTAKDQLMDPKQAFSVVVESMILGSRDEDFFTSSDFRENDGIATAFRKVFDPLLLLEKDVRSQAWSKQFATALEYPEISSWNKGNSGWQICEACNRSQRYASQEVSLTGRQYDRHSLKPLAQLDEDGSESSDSGPRTMHTFHIGVHCAERCSIYHDIRHFKYFLLQRCRQQVQNSKLCGETTETIVNRLIKEDTDFLDMEYKTYNIIMKTGRKLVAKRLGNSLIE